MEQQFQNSFILKKNKLILYIISISKNLSQMKMKFKIK